MLYRIPVKDVNYASPIVDGTNIAYVRRTASQRAALAAALHLRELAFVGFTEGQACALAKVSRPWARLAARLEPALRRQVLVGELELVAAAAVPTREILEKAIRRFGVEDAFQMLIERERELARA